MDLKTGGHARFRPRHFRPTLLQFIWVYCSSSSGSAGLRPAFLLPCICFLLSPQSPALYIESVDDPGKHYELCSCDDSRCDRLYHSFLLTASLILSMARLAPLFSSGSVTFFALVGAGAGGSFLMILIDALDTCFDFLPCLLWSLERCASSSLFKALIGMHTLLAY